MGTTNRPQAWKWGDLQPVDVQPPVALVKIAKGDLIAQASGTITGATSGASITVGTPYPASETPWTTDLPTTQALFSAKFLGVANSAVRPDGIPVDILAGTTGVWEFDCASASFKVGDLVGPAKQSGSLLEDQKVAAVSDENMSIGKVVRATTSATKVWVKIFTRVLGKTPPTPA